MALVVSISVTREQAMSRLQELSAGCSVGAAASLHLRCSEVVWPGMPQVGVASRSSQGSQVWRWTPA